MQDLDEHDRLALRLARLRTVAPGTGASVRMRAAAQREWRTSVSREASVLERALALFGSRALTRAATALVLALAIASGTTIVARVVSSGPSAAPLPVIPRDAAPASPAATPAAAVTSAPAPSVAPAQVAPAQVAPERVVPARAAERQAGTAEGATTAPAVSAEPTTSMTPLLPAVPTLTVTVSPLPLPPVIRDLEPGIPNVTLP